MKLSSAFPLFSVVTATLVIACAPPYHATGGTGALLYAVNLQDHTVSQFDALSGRPLGPPIPVGGVPTHVAAAGADRLLVLTGAPRGALTLLTRTAASGGSTWQSRPLLVAPEAGVTSVAVDEHGHYAVVTYATPVSVSTVQMSSCRVALLDTRSGAVQQTHPLCARGEEATGLDLHTGPEGPVLYATLWRSEHLEAGRWMAPAGRVVALHAETGTTLASVPLGGLPAQVTLGPAPDALGRRVYYIEAVLGADQSASSHPSDDFWMLYEDADAWRLVSADARTMQPEQEYTFSFWPRLLRIAPDGTHAYALAGPLTHGPHAGVILYVDLVTGAAGTLAAVPGFSLDLAVTANRLYVPDGDNHDIWALDRRRGTVVDHLPTGNRPTLLTLATP